MSAPDKPRLVVLDSSQLGELARDAASHDRARRRKALRFMPSLLARGWLPLLSLHHIEELLQHDNEQVVDNRLSYLWNLDFVAWIGDAEPDSSAGSVVMLMAAEALTAHRYLTAEAVEVRNLTRDRVIYTGPSTSAVPAAFAHWREFREEFKEHQVRTRRVAAIARWRPTPIGNMRLGELLQLPTRSQIDIDRRINGLQGRLTQEIATRGDKRIADPRAMAAEFFAEVRCNATGLNSGSHVPGALQILQAAGVDVDTVDPNTTFDQLMERVMFENQLRVATEGHGLSWEAIKRTVTQDRLPVSVITHTMRMYGQDQPERKGSEVTDIHLLALAPYADVSYVDKRTLEGVRRGRRSAPTFDRLLNDVRKASSYDEVHRQLIGFPGAMS